MISNLFIQKETFGRTFLPDEKFYRTKILVVRTRNISLNKRIIATIDTEKYNLNRLSNIIAKMAITSMGFRLIKFKAIQLVIFNKIH